ncbi:succinate dehydrogenase/fumarate reductase flavoprotein subunit (plasmid) [Cupriavidus necator N-1]|uniref:Succinate dehydrogenase/fumarate reductase flavoprotein subunit n=1 Tax=Cupriavidus necator (strain ATCC 43291 / DSM 13513 / CCUG 52238 / LMG 8453 / N-1) TaxID=1042878 RepID=F8GYL3_CUPNN|nr:FAD-binding protein [Cupriavidus necator]AEI82954.1 succinate dehydrogenase/fumarate reductase flavoprotein subunit [Cupriavidus necator N-1]MDX6008742.1 FAD-binding protein [Cupriavidus necator]
MNTENNYDIIVIGCGAAGLATAIAYAEAADRSDKIARIALLERAPEEERGGATQWTAALLRIAEDGRFDTNWRQLVDVLGGGLPDQEYCATLEKEVPATLEFLTSRGVPLERLPWPAPINFAHGEVKLQTVMHPVNGGAGIVSGLFNELTKHKGVEVHYRTEAVRLSISDDGAVNGVVVRKEDGRLRTLHGNNVMIASGGFEGNKEMLTRYLGSNACDLVPIVPGIKNNRGEGITMAIEVGADTSGQFDMFHAEAIDPRSSQPDAVVWATPYGIVVNSDAKRFFDEGSHTLDRTFELLGYEIWKNQNQRAFWITDQQIANLPGILAINFTDVDPIAADSIEGLAENLGLDPSALESTIAEFNSACGSQTFDHTRLDGKSTTGITPPKSNWANPIEQGPFLAVPLTGGITFTFGGIRTDTVGRVLTPAGTPIAGLYAAGEVTGLYYHEYPAATSVLRSVTFGRLAGTHAATCSPSRDAHS